MCVSPRTLIANAMDRSRSPLLDLESGPTSNEGGMDEKPDDFDDSADKLWSLYEDVAKRHDEARIRALKDDMDGIIVYAGLLSAVIASFVVPTLQGLQVDRAEQSVYYQQQSAQILVQISQQIALIGTQIPLNATSISPYSTPRPSSSDRRVTIFWLISLVFSLSAALLSTLVQQWVRVYMRVYQRHNSPSNKTRIRQYLSEGVEGLPAVAEAPPCLILLSLVLFLFGLGDSVLRIDRTVGVATVVPMSFCGSVFLYYVIAPIWNPQSPYRNPFSDLILPVIQLLRRSPFRERPRPRGAWHARMEARQEDLVMEPKKRKDLDVRAVQWLVGNMDRKTEMESFVLAIPGIFNQAWGKSVLKAFSTQGNLPSSAKGATFDDLCRYVQHVFRIYSNEGDPDNEKAQRKRLHGYVETVAYLVCCTDVQLGRFGKVTKVLSDLGPTKGATELPTIRFNSSFTVRWTCLSLVAFRKTVMVEGERIRELAGSAVDVVARFQSGYMDRDGAAFKGAQRIDEYLKEAWNHVENLYQAFGPRDQERSVEEIREISEGCELQISHLERIANEANGMESVDRGISLLQDAMDRATDKLTRGLPGVSFNELKSSEAILIKDAFEFPILGITSVTPQLVFPGQQVRALCTVGRGLRDIIEERNPEKHPETIRNLESIINIPISSRRLKDLMIRQLWRLQDLRYGGGLGFTIELFFLACRQLSSTSSSPESEVFYTGTFDVIESGWENITDLSGTQMILLNLICDLVIKNRGLFSGFSYPEYIAELLLGLVRKMVDMHGNAYPHIHDAVDELWWATSRNVNKGLRDKALLALGPFPLPMYGTASSSS